MPEPTPNYVDLQVNGYAGADFNADDLTPEALNSACQRLASDGVDAFLATVITDDVERIAARLERLVALRNDDPVARTLIAGFHVEGPFLSGTPGYIGAHPAEFARQADPTAMQRMLDAAAGLVRIVTLAPECDPGMKTTKMLASQNVCVAAGHCDPTLDQLKAAIDAGLTMFTHLGNGCPALLPRHDNVIQRALSLADQLWISLIADGIHVPWHALGNYIRTAGIDRCLVVTDAISAAGQGPGRYRLGDREVVVDESGATWSADRSHLCGSAATMPQLASRLESQLGLSPREVAQLTSSNPRRAIGLAAA